MPTSKQMKARNVRIREAARALQAEPGLLASVDKTILNDVLALCLHWGCISVKDIPPKRALDVVERFLKQAPDHERDDKGEIGTDVHELFERIANGEVLNNVPAKYKGHVAAFRQFVSDYGVTFLRTEFTVESVRFGYMGTGDALVESVKRKDMGKILIDYKSSESGIWPDIALQLAALRYADHILSCNALPHGDDYVHQPQDAVEVPGVLEEVNSYAGVQITTEGYMFVPVNVSDNTFRVFRAAQIVADWKSNQEKYALEKAEFVYTKAA